MRHFKDQVSSFSYWFGDLCGTEQVVVLCTLVRKLEPSYLRLLTNIVQRADSASRPMANLELKANDSDSVRQIGLLTAEEAASQLLALFPLMRPLENGGSVEVKMAYLNLLSAILSTNTSIIDDDWTHQLHQLASLAVIHPALNRAERQMFSDWLRQTVTQPLTPSSLQIPTMPPTRTDSGLELDSDSPNYSCLYEAANVVKSPMTCVPSPQPTLSGPQQRYLQPLNRQLNISGNGAAENSTAVSQNTIMAALGLPTSTNTVSPNSSGFLSDHAPLSPMSSASSNGDISWSFDNAPALTAGSNCGCTLTSANIRSGAFQNDGMRDVPSWLKGLRLHKYAYLFYNLTYDEMLAISDTWLDSKNVTKGARNKILLSVRKLQERESILQQVIEQLSAESVMPAQLRACLAEIRAVLLSPLRKPLEAATPIVDELTADTVAAAAVSTSDYVGGLQADSLAPNLPSLIITCLTKACSLLLTTRRFDDDCYATFTNLIDYIQENEAFVERQKILVNTWREQMSRSRGQPLRKYLHPPSRSLRAGLSLSGGGSLGLPSAQWSQFSPQKAGQSPRRPPRILESGGPVSISLPLPTGSNVVGTSNNATRTAAAAGFHLPLMKHNSFTAAGGGVGCGGMFPSCEDTLLRRPIERTYSAPNQASMTAYFAASAVASQGLQHLHHHMSIDDANYIGNIGCESAEEVAINADLESLALRMTEAALEESPSGLL